MGNKINTILLFVMLCLSLTVHAQISEEDKSMTLGLKNALVLELPNTSGKFVEKLWKKQLKDYKGKTKKDKKADEFFTDDASISSIGGSNTIDLYSKISEAGETVYLSFWVDFGGAFLSSNEHPDQYNEAEKLLMRFGLEVTKEMTRIELEAEEKTLKKHEADLKRLERDNERYHREIELAREKIAKAEKNIETNIIEQEETKKVIEEQGEVVKEVQQRLEDF